MNQELIKWLKNKDLTAELEEIILKIDKGLYQIADETRMGNAKEIRISYGPLNSNKRSNVILFPKRGLNVVRLQIKVRSYYEVNTDICRKEFQSPAIREHGNRFIEKEIKSPAEITDKLIDFLTKGVNKIN